MSRQPYNSTELASVLVAEDLRAALRFESALPHVTFGQWAILLVALVIVIPVAACIGAAYDWKKADEQERGPDAEPPSPR